MSNNQRKGLKAWVRYDGNNIAVAGSLIFQKSKPKVGKWREYQDVNLCCLPPQEGGYRCCVAIQAVPQTEVFLYGFSLECRDNGGPNLTGTIHWTSTESESFSIPPDETFDFFYNFPERIPYTVYLCVDNPEQIQDFEIGFGPGTSTAISNLYRLEGLDEWDGDDMAFTSLDFTGITTMTEIFNDNTGLQHINITGCVNLNDVQLYENNLTQYSVDHVLITLDNSGLSNGAVDVSGGTNASPSSAGLDAIGNLISKGWYVVYNP